MTTTKDTTTEQDTPQEPLEGPQDAPEPQAPDQADQDGDQVGGNAEAAKYRRRLREAEAQRDTLAARVEALQRGEVERLAGEHVTKPSALWAAGIDLAGLLDAEGNIDPDKVSEAVTAAADELGLSAPTRTPAPDLTQGGRGGVAADPDRWRAAFKPAG